MKKLIIFLGLIAMGLGQSCSNEFKLTEDWKDITIVYGLLDASDTAQYIRIEKAFLDESTSALVIAQEADSLFYSNINVSLQAISSGGQGGGFVDLELVDANLEGFQKEPGIFATSPNYVYKVTEPLKPTFLYKLIIEKGDGGPTVEVITDVIGEFNILRPNNTPPLRPLNFRSNRDESFQWKSEPNAAFFDVVLRMNYREAVTSAPNDFVDKSADWLIFENVIDDRDPDVRNGSLVFVKNVDGALFYQWVQTTLDEGNYIRELVDFDVFVYAGGDELNNYINAGLVSAGLTSVEILPVYTNVENGLGIFSTRYTQSETGIVPSDAMLDTLANGPYTKNLGFRN